MPAGSRPRNNAPRVRERVPLVRVDAQQTATPDGPAAPPTRWRGPRPRLCRSSTSAWSTGRPAGARPRRRSPRAAPTGSCRSVGSARRRPRRFHPRPGPRSPAPWRVPRRRRARARPGVEKRERVPRALASQDAAPLARQPPRVLGAVRRMAVEERRFTPSLGPPRGSKTDESRIERFNIAVGEIIGQGQGDPSRNRWSSASRRRASPAFQEPPAPRVARLQIDEDVPVTRDTSRVRTRMRSGSPRHRPVTESYSNPCHGQRMISLSRPYRYSPGPLGNVVPPRTPRCRGPPWCGHRPTTPRNAPLAVRTTTTGIVPTMNPAIEPGGHSSTAHTLRRTTHPAHDSP